MANFDPRQPHRDSPSTAGSQFSRIEADLADVLAEEDQMGPTNPTGPAVDQTSPIDPEQDDIQDPATLIPSPIPQDVFLPHLRAIDLPPSTPTPAASQDGHTSPPPPGPHYAFFIPQDDFQEFSSMLASAPPGAFPWKGLLLPARFIPDSRPGHEGELRMLLQIASLDSLYEWILREIQSRGTGTGTGE